MAYHSNLHHSYHPNVRQPYPRRTMGTRRDEDFVGGAQRGSAPYQSASSPGSTGPGMLTNSRNTLWMGNIDESMSESSIQAAFQSFGVEVANVKIIRDKNSGRPLGYGFVTFGDRTVAQNVLRELNGKPITNGDDKRFFLKPSSRNPTIFSVFVGNLSPEINGDILKQAFSQMYPSVASARVISSEGQSKGYGFVNFEDEYEFQSALGTPNMMLGDFPITIGRARNPANRTNGAGPMGGGPGSNNGFSDDMRGNRSGRSGSGRDFDNRM